jgi:putative oxidoreductase
MVDQLARACRTSFGLARSAFRPHYGRLGFFVEWLGQASQSASSHREFHRLGHPGPHLLAPFVSAVEFFGGLFLLAGLCTRISAGALGVTMIVAIRSAKWTDVDSLEGLLGFDEFEYLALFLWLAIAGAGPLSLDHLLPRTFGGAAARASAAMARSADETRA